MACRHKFIADLQLEYVNWEVRSLFIGTFNPSWAACIKNNSEWFYGRTARNSFWCVLSQLHEGLPNNASGRTEWIDFCRRNGIAVTDILRMIDNADENNPDHRTMVCKFRDDDIERFNVTVNNIPEILQRHPTIQQVCITRQSLPGFWEACFQDTINWIEQHQEIQLLKLRSPSRGARRGVIGDHCLFVANTWIQQGYVV